MKSIIMTAQDAREFEKLGGLTITKPIKPAPVAYVEGAKMEEVSPGAWNLIREGAVLLGRRARLEGERPGLEVAFIPHWKTCPNAGRFRKGGRS